MSAVRTWETGAAPDAAFAAAWAERLRRAPQANFTMRMDFLLHEHAQGRPSRLALVEEGARAGALALRRVRGGFVSGWPWRWQMVLADPASPHATGLEPGDRDWLLVMAREVARGARLRAFLPVLADGPSGFAVGLTLIRHVPADDETLMNELGSDRRRIVRKSERDGWSVRLAASDEERRQFRALQIETEIRHGTATASEVEVDPPAGTAWREWELPWHALIVAEQGGVVHAGSGFGVTAGGTMDYRTNASDEVGRKAGANALLGIAGLRMAREQNMPWLNWGGATAFKRQLGGVPVEIECRLLGGALWSVPNTLETRWQQTRPQVAALARRLRPKPGGAPANKATTQAWSTRNELPEAFAKAWTARLQKSPGANFTLSLDHVQWEAKHGRHACLVLAEEGPRRAAIVLREKERELVCGWPWRWQAAIEGTPAAELPVPSDEDAAWLFARAQQHTDGRRLRMYLPNEPGDARPAFYAGATVVQSLQVSDEELVHGMDPNKRRLLRRARGAWFEVREASSAADFEAFGRCQHAAKRLRDGEAAGELPDAPEAGESWREWELPWMWLLLAHRGDAVVGGVGDGLVPGGVADGRAAASTLEGRQSGVMVLLCHEEARLLRDRGHHWLNHGGDTVFKREIAGTLGHRVPVWCWLGGGSAWRLANRTEAWARRTRPRVSAWAQAVGVRGAGRRNG